MLIGIESQHLSSSRASKVTAKSANALSSARSRLAKRASAALVGSHQLDDAAGEVLEVSPPPRPRHGAVGAQVPLADEPESIFGHRGGRGSAPLSQIGY